MTPEQLTTLKTAMLADINLTALVAANEHGAIAAYYNAPSTFVVWRSTTPLGEISDAITWANLTPNDTPDGTTAWQCRSLACQGKQFNLQIIFGAQGIISTGKSNVRAGLQDALTNIPSGTAGAIVAAGWTTVRTTMQRVVSKGEEVFATGTGTAGSPGNLGYEGNIGNNDVVDALRS